VGIEEQTRLQRQLDTIAGQKQTIKDQLSQAQQANDDAEMRLAEWRSKESQLNELYASMQAGTLTATVKKWQADVERMTIIEMRAQRDVRRLKRQVRARPRYRHNYSFPAL
jgi:chromosome segregation ATPase